MNAINLTPKRTPLPVPPLFFDGQIYPCEVSDASWMRDDDALIFRVSVRLFVSEFRAQILYVDFPEKTYTLYREGNDAIPLRTSCIIAHRKYVSYWRKVRQSFQRRFFASTIRMGMN